METSNSDPKNGQLFGQGIDISLERQPYSRRGHFSSNGNLISMRQRLNEGSWRGQTWSSREFGDLFVRQRLSLRLQNTH